jgi:multiple sugar transport system ATP-binding protein
MGNETFLHARAGAQELTARVSPVELPEPGKEVDLALDLGKLHLFDGDSEARIAD